MALNYGAAVTGSLHERVGEEELLAGDDGGVVEPSGAWLRLFGDDVRWDAERGGIYRNGPRPKTGNAPNTAAIGVIRVGGWRLGVLGKRTGAGLNRSKTLL
ncbi:MAG: hypothetical protein WDN08_22155 [Rhizomicrobium sp.]